MANKANVEPPQEYHLPLLTGFSGANAVYWKNQFGEVHIQGNVTKNSNYIDGDIIAVMPEGFRPTYDVEQPAVLGGEYQGAIVQVMLDGNVALRLNPTNCTHAYLSATFISAQ